MNGTVRWIGPPRSRLALRSRWCRFDASRPLSFFVLVALPETTGFDASARLITWATAG